MTGIGGGGGIVSVQPTGRTRMSASLGELAKALTKAQTAFPVIPRTKTVRTDKFSYSYADLADVLDAVRQPLADAGLAVTQPIRSENGQTVVATLLIHSSGEWLESTCALIGGQTMQQMGSAITYARRYALTSVLGIATEDDDDATSTAPKPKRAAKPKAEPKNVASILATKRAALEKTVKGEGIPPARATALLAEWFKEGTMHTDLDAAQLETATEGMKRYGSTLRECAALGSEMDLSEEELMLVAADVWTPDEVPENPTALSDKELTALRDELRNRKAEAK